MKPFRKLVFNNGSVLPMDRPRLIGVINLTPDSFYEGVLKERSASLEEKMEEMDQARVDLIDLGGESTRPGAERISLQEELERVIPKIKWIKKKYPHFLLSIDTYKVEVAQRAVEEGVDMINDVSSGEASNDKMLELVARLNCPIVLMHQKGIPVAIGKEISYENLLEEINFYFRKKLDILSRWGIGDNKIILDPGIGFGKNLEHNISLIKNIKHLKKLGYPILIGASRKKMIGDLTGRKIDLRLGGSIAVHLAAIQNGADLVRVHDARAMRDAIKVYEECVN